VLTRAGQRKLDELRVEDTDPKKPWGGRSPRVLTRAHERFILRHEAAPLDEGFGDEKLIEEQCRRHFHGS